MPRKKSRKQIRKAFNGWMKEAEGEVNVGKGLKQNVRIIEKVPLEQDEFTEHKELKSILAKFVIQAHDAQSHYQTKIKQMVREVALSLEEKLIEMGKPEFICHISEELVSILKQHKIKWNAIYIRRCLEEKYKDPTYRLAALARHERNKKENAGVPSDTGRTVEELEEALRREQIGEFVVGTTFKFAKSFVRSKKSETKFRKEVSHWLIETQQKLIDGTTNEREQTATYFISLPVIVKVNVKERDAIVEMDIDAWNKKPSGVKVVEVGET
jgi:hypothetical protein